MADQSLSDLTLDELKSKQAKIKTIQISVAVIFALILGAWFVLGYWKENLALVGMTAVLAAGSFIGVTIPGFALAKEIASREKGS
ncbi:MAG: hypothetical protein EA360_09320 [Balneolaceae bacterium]|nr:MAG: hypothetical protein EA360_09320 [Balneolaceae bacterium]